MTRSLTVLTIEGHLAGGGGLWIGTRWPRHHGPRALILPVCVFYIYHCIDIQREITLSQNCIHFWLAEVLNVFTMHTSSISWLTRRDNKNMIATIHFLLSIQAKTNANWIYIIKFCVNSNTMYQKSIKLC